MVLAVAGGDIGHAGTNEGKANYQQRVFDAFPAFPGTISSGDLYARFPNWDRRMIQNVIAKLRGMRKIEAVALGLYRLAGDAVARPTDGRGGPRERGKT